MRDSSSMQLSGKQRKFLRKHRHLPLPELAKRTGIPEPDIAGYFGSGSGSAVPAGPDGNPSDRYPLWLYFLIFAVTILGIYAVTLPYAFISDDLAYLVNNPLIHDFRFVTSVPLTSAKAFIDFLILQTAGLNQVFFRLKNILFHLGSVYLLFLIVRKWKDTRTAFMAAILFAVHPIVTESVTWIGGGGYPQYAFFFLASFYFYMSGNGTLQSAAISIGLFLIMLLSSEKSVSLSLAFPLYELARGRLLKNWKRTLPYLALSAFWVFLILGILRYAQTRIQILETSYSSDATGFYNPLVQIPTAITTYLKLLFWPARLSFYQSELSTSVAGYAVRVVVFIAFLLTVAVCFKKNKFAFFFLALFVVSLLPMLTPLKIGWVVAERYVYLGSAAVIAAFSVVPAALAAKPRFRMVTFFLLGFIVLALATRTMIRNSDWQNQDTLWIATGKTAPSDPKTHNNLGDMYGRHGDLKKARAEFELAVKLDPRYADGHHNLANVLVQLGETDQAEKEYKTALSLNPGLWQTHQALAVISFNRKDFPDAAAHLTEAIRLNPGNAVLYENLGVTYMKAGDTNRAKAALEKAIALDPENPGAGELLKQLR